MIALSTYPRDPRIKRQTLALNEFEYGVDVICVNSGNLPKVEPEGKNFVYRIIKRGNSENQIRYIFYSFLFMFAAFFKLQTLYLKNKYDIIQVHNLPDYLVFTTLLQKLLGVKVILDIHDPVVDLYEEKWPGKKNSLFKKLLCLSERISCKAADQLMTVSNSCKERLVERGNKPDKISLFINSANEDVFKFNSERNFNDIKDGVKLIYHGTASKRFGLHTVIEAMPNILEKLPDSIFSIYSGHRESYSEDLQKLIRKLDLEKNVFLMDLIPLAEVPEAINSHHIGIVPYLRTDYMNLSLPTKAFEYIAVGTPVLSIRLKEFAEIFDDTCVTYFENNEPAEIAQTVLFTSSDYQCQKEKVENAYSKLQTISGNVMKKNYVNLINKIIYNK